MRRYIPDPKDRENSEFIRIHNPSPNPIQGNWQFATINGHNAKILQVVAEMIAQGHDYPAVRPFLESLDPEIGEDPPDYWESIRRIRNKREIVAELVNIVFN